ncbi:MAG: hypothetical protein QOD09_1098 [Bradyrhizobium sp.]|jgi:hypothetical protein|nr:hypothetical protein [Bradyrhizobium sp.]
MRYTAQDCGGVIAHRAKRLIAVAVPVWVSIGQC